MKSFRNAGQIFCFSCFGGTGGHFGDVLVQLLTKWWTGGATAWSSEEVWAGGTVCACVCVCAAAGCSNTHSGTLWLFLVRNELRWGFPAVVATLMPISCFLKTLLFSFFCFSFPSFDVQGSNFTATPVFTLNVSAELHSVVVFIAINLPKVAFCRRLPF